jgi:hypothetical protein
MKKQMKFRRQGWCECFPTVVAMLTNHTPRYIIKRMLAVVSYTSWEEFVKFGTQDIPSIDKMFLIVQEMLPWLTLECFKRLSYNMTTGYQLEGLDLTGRGVITIVCLFTRHIVAYQDGIIYDPFQKKPMTVQEWRKILDEHGWTIDLVQPEKTNV